MYTFTQDLTFAHIEKQIQPALAAAQAGEDQFTFAQDIVVDSSALALLISLQRTLQKQNKTICLQQVPINLENLLSLYDVQEVFGGSTAKAI